MKLNWKVLCTGFAAVILLTACGTDANPKEDTNSNTSGQVTDGTNGSSADNNDSADVNETDGNNTSDNLTEAQLTESDEQPFSIKVLPEYTLTSEEPGRDSLYAEQNSNAFMRIETRAIEDGAYDNLLENMKEVLIASSDGKEPEEVADIFTAADENEIKNVKAFKVESNEGPVTGILFEKEDKIVRLTIFDTVDEEYKTDFINMAQTIE